MFVVKSDSDIVNNTKKLGDSAVVVSKAKLLWVCGRGNICSKSHMDNFLENFGDRVKEGNLEVV